MLRRVIVVTIMVLIALIISVPVLGAAEKPLQGQVVVVCNWPMSILDPVHKIIKEFEDATGARVLLDLMGESAVRERLTMEFATKNPVHNVVLLDCWNSEELKDYFVPLNDFIAQKSKPVVNGLDDFNIQDFDPSYVNIMNVDGQQIGLPYYWEVAGLHYRKDLFEKYNVKVPTNIDELLEAAKKLTLDTNGDGIIDIYGIAMRSVRGEDSGLMCSGAAWSFGGTWFEGGAATAKEIREKKARPSVNSKQWIDAFTFYGNLLSNYGPPGVTSYSWPEVMRDMEEGKLAMDIDANYFVGPYNDPKISKVAGKVSLAVPPKGPGGRVNQHGFVCGLGIPKGAKDQEAAWEFIKWYTAKSTVARSIIPGMRLNPCHPALIESDEYKKAFGEIGDAMLATAAAADWEYMPRFPEISQPTFILVDAWSNVIAGIKTPEEALNEAQKEILKVMTEAGYYK